MCRMTGNFHGVPFSRMVHLYLFTSLHFCPLCTIIIKLTVIREYFVVKNFHFMENYGNFFTRIFFTSSTIHSKYMVRIWYERKYCYTEISNTKILQTKLMRITVFRNRYTVISCNCRWSSVDNLPKINCIDGCSGISPWLGETPNRLNSGYRAIWLMYCQLLHTTCGFC